MNDQRERHSRAAQHQALRLSADVAWPERDPRIFLVGPLEHVFTSLPLYGANPAHPHALIDARFETFTNFLVALDNGDVAL